MHSTVSADLRVLDQSRADQEMLPDIPFQSSDVRRTYTYSYALTLGGAWHGYSTDSEWSHDGYAIDSKPYYMHKRWTSYKIKIAPSMLDMVRIAGTTRAGHDDSRQQGFI